MLPHLHFNRTLTTIPSFRRSLQIHLHLRFATSNLLELALHHSKWTCILNLDRSSSLLQIDSLELITLISCMKIVTRLSQPISVQAKMRSRIVRSPILSNPASPTSACVLASTLRLLFFTITTKCLRGPWRRRFMCYLKDLLDNLWYDYSQPFPPFLPRQNSNVPVSRFHYLFSICILDDLKAHIQRMRCIPLSWTIHTRSRTRFSFSFKQYSFLFSWQVHPVHLGKQL